jgi:hypothetical protein
MIEGKKDRLKRLGNFEEEISKKKNKRKSNGTDAIF